MVQPNALAAYGFHKWWGGKGKRASRHNGDNKDDKKLVSGSVRAELQSAVVEVTSTMVYAVSCESYPPAAEVEHSSEWSALKQKCWSPQGIQGHQGEEDHTAPPSASHSKRLGARRPHYEHHCRWWSHHPHLQVPD
ncbi:hypothetical protein ZIOFF_017578 [Zingiber officinale]|uniref:Uncharacterized protein n=1 Tax=Zingiber officinale TaxID=94328 RepID=A0A8J5HTQ5_ZINOF|nr:hypothetical protein ZIOFF_017578 [Zingiber officinale]